MSARVKMISLIIFGTVGALWFALNLGHDSVGLPGGYTLLLGMWYIPLFIFLIITLFSETHNMCNKYFTQCFATIVHF